MATDDAKGSPPRQAAIHPKSHEDASPAIRAGAAGRQASLDRSSTPEAGSRDRSPAPSMTQREIPGAAAAADPGPVRLDLAEAGSSPAATAGASSEDPEPDSTEASGARAPDPPVAAAGELDAVDRVSSIVSGVGIARSVSSTNAPGGFLPVLGSGSSSNQPSPSIETTPTTAANITSAAPLAAAAALGGGKDGGDAPHGQLPGDSPSKDLSPPAAPLPGLHPSTVDPPPDNRTGAAAASSRPAGAEVVTLPNLAVRVAQLAVGLPDRSPIAVRLRLDPPTLGEIRVQIESSARGIEVRIVAQSREACALLADGQPHLRQELARHGMALHSFAASVGEEGPNDRTASGRDSRKGQQSVDSGPTATVHSPAATAAPAAAPAAGDRGLDRRV